MEQYALADFDDYWALLPTKDSDVFFVSMDAICLVAFLAPPFIHGFMHLGNSKLFGESVSGWRNRFSANIQEIDMCLLRSESHQLSISDVPNRTLFPIVDVWPNVFRCAAHVHRIAAIDARTQMESV